MTFQRLVLIATAVLALVFSAAVTAGKGGGGQGGMAGMGGVDAPKTMSQERSRVEESVVKPQGEIYRERLEGDPVAGPKGGSGSGKGGKGGGGKDPQINPLRE